jgi:hypothetical protein
VREAIESAGVNPEADHRKTTHLVTSKFCGYVRFRSASESGETTRTGTSLPLAVLGTDGCSPPISAVHRDLGQWFLPTQVGRVTPGRLSLKAAIREPRREEK